MSIPRELLEESKIQTHETTMNIAITRLHKLYDELTMMIQPEDLKLVRVNFLSMENDVVTLITVLHEQYVEEVTRLNEEVIPKIKAAKIDDLEELKNKMKQIKFVLDHACEGEDIYGDIYQIVKEE